MLCIGHFGMAVVAPKLGEAAGMVEATTDYYQPWSVSECSVVATIVS
jgi:hypothetical protein